MKKRLLLVLLLLPCLVVSLFALLRLVTASLFNPDRAQRVAVAFDQLANAAADGDEDETISSRAAKAARLKRPWACVLCRVLDRFDPGHCENNIEPDRGQALPPL